MRSDTQQRFCQIAIMTTFAAVLLGDEVFIFDILEDGNCGLGGNVERISNTVTDVQGVGENKGILRI